MFCEMIVHPLEILEDQSWREVSASVGVLHPDLADAGLKVLDPELDVGQVGQTDSQGSLHQFLQQRRRDGRGPRGPGRRLTEG